MLLLEQYWQEFMDFVDRFVTGAREEGGIDLEVALRPSASVEACARRLSHNKFEIMVTTRIRDSIFKETIVDNIFKPLIETLQRQYHCSDPMEYFQKAFCFNTWAILFCHECGHIIKGHALLLPLSAALTETVPCDGDAIEPAFRSILEFDADLYAGQAVGPVSKFMLFEGPNEQAAEMTGMAVISVSTVYLMAFLNKHGREAIGDDIYPPYRARLNGLALSYLNSRRHYLENSDIQREDHRLEPSPLDVQVYKNIIALAMETLHDLGYPALNSTPEREAEWKGQYEAYKDRLLSVHDRMRTLFPSKKDPKLRRP